MKLIFMKLLQGLASLFLAAVLSVPAWGSNNASSNSAVPGTLNYVEGQVSLLQISPLDHNSIGKIRRSKLGSLLIPKTWESGNSVDRRECFCARATILPSR